jgi:hypothetical protein
MPGNDDDSAEEFGSPSDHAAWKLWEAGLRRGESDPDEWIYFPGERRWYRSAELIHIRQLAALAGQPTQLDAPLRDPTPEPTASGDEALDEVLADVGWVRK